MARMLGRLISLIALVLPVQIILIIQTAGAACIPINSPQGLLDIQNDPTASYCLTSDIDATTLGTIDRLDRGLGFSGTLDGNGYTIRNITLTGNQGVRGLFGTLSNTGVIQNLTLANVVAVASDGCCGGYFGTLVGENLGTVRQTSAILMDLNKAHATYVGGLVGKNSGLVQQSYTTGRIDGLHNPGGLVSWNALGGSIDKSYSAVRVVTADCHEFGGGLVAYDEGTLRQSFAVGGVRADCSTVPTFKIGGLACARFRGH